MKAIWHIFQLGLKELVSLSSDPVLLFLIFYSFTFSVYTPAKSAVMDVVNASVAVVDEDGSEASRTIRESMLPPLFLPAAEIPFGSINHDMDRGLYTFVVDVPPNFQQDLEKNASPEIQIVTDATAMSQAGRGPGYIQKIITPAVTPYWSDAGNPNNQPLVQLDTRGALQRQLSAGLVRRDQPGDQQHLGAGDLPDRRGGAA